MSPSTRLIAGCVCSLLTLPERLAFASQQNPQLATLPGNTALDLGQYQCTPRAGEGLETCASNSNYSGMEYDPVRHAIYLFGGGHSATFRDDVDVFDFQSLSWQSASPPTPCSDLRFDNLDPDYAFWRTTNHPVSRHTYDLMALAGTPSQLLMMSTVHGRAGGCSSLPPVDPDAGSPDQIATGHIATYNIEAKTWQYSVSPSFDFGQAVETDPVSGQILVVDNGGLHTVDPASGVVTDLTMSAVPGMSWEASLVYFPPNDRFYWMNENGGSGSDTTNEIFEIQFDRVNPSLSVVRPINVAPPAQPAADGWAYDSVNQLIGGGVNNNYFFAFDPITPQWLVRQIQPAASDAGTVNCYGLSTTPPVSCVAGTIDGWAIAYDPVDNVYIFRTDWGSGARTFAYRWGGIAPAVPDGGPDVVDAGAGLSSDAGSGVGVDAGAGLSSDAGSGVGVDAGAGLSSDADSGVASDAGGSSGLTAKVRGGCGCTSGGGAPSLEVVLALGFAARWIGRGRRSRRSTKGAAT